MAVIMQIGDVVHSLMQTLKDKGILTEEEEREIVARAQRNAEQRFYSSFTEPTPYSVLNPQQNVRK